MLLEHHKEAEKTTMCTLKITLFVFNYRKKKYMWNVRGTDNLIYLLQA